MSSAYHLYSSRVAVYRGDFDMEYGTPTENWYKVQTLLDARLGVIGELRCRLDLNFIRMGKDAPMAVTAGRAPDRVGVLFFDYTPHLKAGDRIKTVSGPVAGVFEIRAVPDIALGYSSGHHCETSVIEVAQALGMGIFPGAQPEE